MAANMKEAMMELGSDAFVNRIKHAALSLSAPNALASFRKIFKRILKECIDIDMEASPDPRVVERNTSAVEMLWPSQLS